MPGLTAVVQQHFPSAHTHTHTHAHTHILVLFFPTGSLSILINALLMRVRNRDKLPCLRHVRPSVRTYQRGSQWTDFRKFWCCGNFMIICRETPNLVTNGQKLLSCCMNNYVRFTVAGNASSPLPHRCTTTPSISLLLPVT